jgi:hypothetical protein
MTKTTDVDLRKLAIILDIGREAAENMGDAVMAATLAAMTEVTVQLAIGNPAWNVEEDFAALVRRYE